MRLTISHSTRYTYDPPVNYGLQKLRLRPANNTQQTITHWDIDITGGRVETSYSDHYGNLTDLVSVDAGTTALEITAHGVVDTNDTAGVLGQVYGRAPLWHFMQPTPLTEPGPRIRALARQLRGDDDPLNLLHALSTTVLEEIPYEAGHTGVDTTAEDALKIGRGVCQDHTQIFIAAARLADMPARYVSGYLELADQVNQDASHAWAEVHLDTLGWVGFDVSNRISPDERYVRVATGRDARDAAPISGLRMGTSVENLLVTLQVQQ